MTQNDSNEMKSRWHKRSMQFSIDCYPKFSPTKFVSFEFVFPLMYFYISHCLSRVLISELIEGNKKQVTKSSKLSDHNHGVTMESLQDHGFPWQSWHDLGSCHDHGKITAELLSFDYRARSKNLIGTRFVQKKKTSGYNKWLFLTTASTKKEHEVTNWNVISNLLLET